MSFYRLLYVGPYFHLLYIMSFDHLLFVGPYFALYHVILSSVIYKAVFCFTSLWLNDVSFVELYFALHHVILSSVICRVTFCGSGGTASATQKTLSTTCWYLFVIYYTAYPRVPKINCRPVLINKRIQSYCVGLILNSLRYLIIIILILIFILRNIKTTNFATFIGNST